MIDSEAEIPTTAKKKKNGHGQEWREKMMQKKSYGLDTSPFFMKLNRAIYYNVKWTRVYCIMFM